MDAPNPTEITPEHIESLSNYYSSLSNPELELELDFLEIPPSLLLPPDFLDSLDEHSHRQALIMCVICWKVSNSRIFPRQYQIEASLATLNGRDSIVDVGTGKGKTLCSILPSFVRPNDLAIVVSPLCRLQKLQLEEFRSWGLRAVSINQHTPKDDKLYKVGVL
jgi:hypothetical protein